jgi:hypothetical protein
MGIQQPLTYLFVPGNRPERFAKALASGADRVILDLEDAVAPADKPMARDAIASWVSSLAASDIARLLVRINDVSSPCHADDLLWLQKISVKHCMLSKCESAEQVTQVYYASRRQRVALIETVRGVLRQRDCAGRQVNRLAFACWTTCPIWTCRPRFGQCCSDIAMAHAPPSCRHRYRGHARATRARSDLSHARLAMAPRCASIRHRWPWCARPSSPTR